MKSVQGQLTLRGVVIGCAGCTIITAASVYTALKMGALPWPIVFAAMVSLFFLKAVSRGTSSLNEANVTHTVMSAGAMVAGGLAFTIPGAWMLGYASEISWSEMLIVALAGVAMGLICTATLRKHFVEDIELEYPIGEAAAQTLIAGNDGGKVGIRLFGAMGFAGLYTALRDILGIIPALLFGNVSIPGVVFGIYNSPMLLAVGFLVGTGAVMVWSAGALIANFGLIVGASAIGLWDITAGQDIVSSLGMGVMMGAGIGVIAKNIIPKAMRSLKEKKPGKRSFNPTIGATACVMAAIVLMICLALGLNPLGAIITVLLTWIATAMSAQSVGQTGIDPMEIFGLIVMLAVAALSDSAQVQLFFVAGMVAVACGLAGDVMNDFHAGHVLGTSPKAQWVGQAIGAVIGAVVSVAVMTVLVNAYGADAFGPGAEFVSAQASVVATMVSGIPHVPAFALGLLAGVILHCLNFPAMMLGLGIYLPFYLSFTAFLGALAKIVYDFFGKEKTEEEHQKTGLIISSGLLGGESIVGVAAAISIMLAGM